MYELPQEEKKKSPPPRKIKLPEPFKGTKIDWLNKKVTELEAPVMFLISKEQVLLIETNMSKAIEKGDI